MASRHRKRSASSWVKYHTYGSVQGCCLVRPFKGSEYFSFGTNDSGNGSPNQVSAKKNLKFMPDAGTSPPLPPQPSPLSPPPTTNQANALGDIKNFEGFGKAGVIPSSLADEGEAGESWNAMRMGWSFRLKPGTRPVTLHTN